MDDQQLEVFSDQKVFQDWHHVFHGTDNAIFV